jgi:hypothetical protein
MAFRMEYHQRRGAVELHPAGREFAGGSDRIKSNRESEGVVETMIRTGIGFLK